MMYSVQKQRVKLKYMEREKMGSGYMRVCATGCELKHRSTAQARSLRSPRLVSGPWLWAQPSWSSSWAPGRGSGSRARPARVQQSTRRSVPAKRRTTETAHSFHGFLICDAMLFAVFLQVVLHEDVVCAGLAGFCEEGREGATRMQRGNTTYPLASQAPGHASPWSLWW